MNEKLTRFANRLQVMAATLLLFSALRADGGLSFWLIPALTGIVLGVSGLALSWLCSPEGLTFRKAHFGEPPVPETASLSTTVIPFPKAG